MKNLNKVLAMLVVFMMMLSTVAFASSFADVADTSSYSTAIDVCVDLGLINGYEDGTFKPEGEITRAEFAAIVVRLKGQEAQASSAAGATQFTDVPADHWAAGYINIATEAKIIKGYGDGKFGPNDLVEYQDAITMLVRALGYEPAVGENNYPTGYLTKAGDLGLTAGVSGTNGVAINRANVVQMAFNALDVPTMSQSGFGTLTNYVINDGTNDTVKKTLLSENHNTVKVQAMVNSSSESVSTAAEPYVNVSITGNNKNKWADDIVRLSNKFYVGESDALNYVGKKVVMFVEYDEFEDECTVKSLYEIATDGLVIDLADVVSYDGAELKYYINDNKTDTITLADNANEYYNGFLGAREISDEDLLDLSGTIEVTLLNPETADADYDTVFITAYEVFVVDEVRAAAGIVSSKIDTTFGKIYFDDEADEYKATLVDANGNAMDFTALEEYDVLSVKYVDTGAKEIFDAKVIENVVTGTVDEISGSEDDRYVVIDGTEYKVLAAAEYEDEIKLGDEGTYYLDDNNNVVYHNATVVKNENYAYVINIKPATEMENAQVKALTKDNGIVTVELASKISVTVKGEKTTNVSVKGLITDANASDYIGQICTFKVNAAGQINAIEIASTDVDPDYEYLSLNFVDADLTDYDADAASFKIGSKKYFIDENTVIFNVEDGADDEDMEVVALANLADGQALVGADVYNVDEDRVIGAIALKEANTISTVADYATFVTKISTAYDEDGYEVVRVTGFAGLEEVSYICEDADDSIVGMLVIPSYKANGDVKSFVVVDEDYENEALELKGYAGTLEALDLDGDEELDSPIDSRRKLLYLNGEEDEELKVPSTANVYVYDATSSMRVKYTVGADFGYFDYDEALGIFVDKDDIDNDVKVYVYEVEGDVVDVVYYIY